MLSIWNSQSTSIFFTSVNNLAALQKWRISNDLNLVLPAPPVPSSLTVWCFSQCLSSWSQRWHDSITYNTAMCPACQTAEKHLKIWPRYELEAQRTKSHNRNTDFFFFLFLKNGTIQASLATSEHMGISHATSFFTSYPSWSYFTLSSSYWCRLLQLLFCFAYVKPPLRQMMLTAQDTKLQGTLLFPLFPKLKKKKKVFRWPMRLDRIVRK